MERTDLPSNLVLEQEIQEWRKFRGGGTWPVSVSPVKRPFIYLVRHSIKELSPAKAPTLSGISLTKDRKFNKFFKMLCEGSHNIEIF